MRIVQINHFSYKAAGSIMMNLHREMTSKGIDSYVVWGRGRQANAEHEYFMGDKLGVNLHALYSRITDRTGFASRNATGRLLKWLDIIRPDIIHLHCIHGYYLNIEMLFEYIRNNNIKVVWTQHDCWAFTGHCAYFDMVGCNKWQDGCFDCKQLNTYPISFRDASQKNWEDKKSLFQGLNIKIVTPCSWLKELVEKSFLSEYPVRVIYNGISTDVFRRTERQFRKEKGIDDKVVLLGVASEWTPRKGLDDFIKLNSLIDKSKYQIVLVGLTKKQINALPNDIIAIQRTNNVQELADIYSSADVFINPTYEDNFPTTNLEALACDTPVITYRTGGSPECISQGVNGFVTDKGNIEEIYFLIKESLANIKNNNLLNKGLFSRQSMIKMYEELYNE